MKLSEACQVAQEIEGGKYDEWDWKVASAIWLLVGLLVMRRGHANIGSV